MSFLKKTALLTISVDNFVDGRPELAINPDESEDPVALTKIYPPKLIPKIHRHMKFSDY